MGLYRNFYARLTVFSIAGSFVLASANIPPSSVSIFMSISWFGGNEASVHSNFHLCKARPI